MPDMIRLLQLPAVRGGVRTPAVKLNIDSEGNLFIAQDGEEVMISRIHVAGFINWLIKDRIGVVDFSDGTTDAHP